MATILLSTVGAAVGGTFGGTVLGLTGAAIGKAVGATIGGLIDQKIMGQDSRVVESGRVDKFRLQGVHEGTPVPRIMGRVRTAGQLIWSSRFLETVTTSTSGGGKGVSKPKVTTKTYSYSVSVAFALGEGAITKVGRIWADGQEISRESLTFTVYNGTETQLPDPVISAVEGLENTPAFRGTAYIVFENLDLGKFGNRIPQMNFEVYRRAQPEHYSVNDPAQNIKGVALIPGTGEYALATTKVEYPGDFGNGAYANVNTTRGGTDLQNALEDLRADVPNVQSVSLVVSWFGDDLRCGNCNIEPAVEQSNVEGKPMVWKVSGQTRTSAKVVGQVAGRPVYGGTPADASVLEAIAEIKAKGQKVVFYPFILMDILAGNGLQDPWTGNADQPVMPWRGRISLSVAPGRTGTPDKTGAASSEVSAFFGTAAATDFTVSGNEVVYSGPNEWSYRRFILHYAHLCKIAGGIEAFNIGSELRGLTQIRDGATTFPVVDALRTLAQDVRVVLGPDVKIGYAADWSEYFGYHPQDGSGDVFFHLDPLWAQAEIDYVGIDNYMPLSDWRDTLGHADEGWGSVYKLDYLKANVAGGEGYDWYYPTQADRDAQNRVAITDGAYGEPWVFRYKDLVSWWSTPHYNRVGGVRETTPTSWQPKSKPFRFTEYGCPAVDKGTNQPNVFYDPKSSESALPHYSDGSVDPFMQAQYLRAVLGYWSDKKNNPVSDVYFDKMVDLNNSHVWAWDSRPWPEFPALSSVWSDGPNHALGHWITGRFHEQLLASVVSEICDTAGVKDIDVSDLFGMTKGYAISSIESARQSLQPLMLAFDFTAHESGGKIVFRNREESIVFTAVPDALVYRGDAPVISKTRAPEAENVGRVRVTFWDDARDYQAGTAEWRLSDNDSEASTAFDLPIVMGASAAQKISARSLVRSRVARDTLKIALPPSVAQVTTNDVIRLQDGETNATYRVERIEEQGARLVEARRIEQQTYKLKDITDVPQVTGVLSAARAPFLRFIDLPLLSSSQSSTAPFVAAASQPWPGQVAVNSSASDDGYELNTVIEAPSQFGKLLSDIAASRTGLWDENLQVHVSLSSGTLQNRSKLEVLNGANVVAIGDGSPAGWEVFQFRNAALQQNGTYILSGLLRGQLGTDADMPVVWPAGSELIFLESPLVQLALPEAQRGLERFFRYGPAGKPLSDETFQTETHSFDLIALRPYSPVHLDVRKDNGDAIVTWVRRTRVDGDTWQGLDVPLGEASEQYLVRVRDGGGTILRETSTVSPTFAYLAPQMATDGASGTITFEVAQVSEKFGPGAWASISATV